MGDRELALGCAQENHGPGDQEFLGGRVHHGLQRSLVDWLERRRAGRGARPRARCDQESNTDQEARDVEMPASSPQSRPSDECPHVVSPGFGLNCSWLVFHIGAVFTVIPTPVFFAKSQTS